MLMLIIFPSDPLEPREPDSSYAHEAHAAHAAGHDVVLVSHEALVNNRDPVGAVRRVPDQAPPRSAIYRGWMMRADQYFGLHAALISKGVTLISDPEAYVHAHHLPESYAVIRATTPRTVWMPGGSPVDFAAVHRALEVFGDKPLIVKDYVKSRKHEWNEACFIPSASDVDAVESVVLRFLELQGEDLAGGLVFREYLDFEPVGTHPKSGMPLTREHRIFWLDGEPLLIANYWEEGRYGAVEPPVDSFREVASRVQSRFFTMDIARTTKGDWLIVELGDGQVAGLPSDNLADEFYRALAARPEKEPAL